MNEIYNAINSELENLSPLEQREFLYSLKIDIPSPVTDQELICWIDFLTFIRDKIRKVDNLFIVDPN